MENSLWRSLWKCRKTDYEMNVVSAYYLILGHGRLLLYPVSSAFYIVPVIIKVSAIQSKLRTATSQNRIHLCCLHATNEGNQQDATTFSFINPFSSTLHVSGDKFAHPQEHFLIVYTAFGSMHRHCCRPVGSSVGALCQKLCIQPKSAPENWRICRTKHVGLN